MRASRLVNLLLLLQSRGGLTAGELADELEVSVRTIHRDVDALSAAGVPIFAERGPHGGIRLVDGYRTRLTGMTADEAEALFLSGLPGPAAELGLGTVVAAARLKVLAALPAELRSRASRLVERFHLDAAGWFQAGEPVPHLGTVSEAVWEGQALRIEYRRERMPVARDLGPLGVVLKGGVWYLVATSDGQIRDVSRLADRLGGPAGPCLRAPGRLRPGRLLGGVERGVRARQPADRGRRAGGGGPDGSPDGRRRPFDGPGRRPTRGPGRGRLAPTSAGAQLAGGGAPPAPRGGLEHRSARAAGGARAAHRDRDADRSPATWPTDRSRAGVRRPPGSRPPSDEAPRGIEMVVTPSRRPRNDGAGSQPRAHGRGRTRSPSAVRWSTWSGVLALRLGCLPSCHLEHPRHTCQKAA